jgi:hypothetical protein
MSFPAIGLRENEAKHMRRPNVVLNLYGQPDAQTAVSQVIDPVQAVRLGVCQENG